MSSLPELPNLFFKAFTVGLLYGLAYVSTFFSNVISFVDAKEPFFFRELASELCANRFPFFDCGYFGKVFRIACS